MFINVAGCKSVADARLSAFGPRWIGVRSFAESCPISNPRGELILELLTVRVDRMSDAFILSRNTADTLIPSESLLLDAKDVIVGRFSLFPEHRPCLTRIGFSEWRDGFPYRVSEFNLPTHAGVAAFCGKDVYVSDWDKERRLYRPAQ